MATIGSVNVLLSAESATFLREIDRASAGLTRFTNDAKRQSDGLTKSFGLATSAMRSLAAGFGIGFGVARFAQAARNAIRWIAPPPVAEVY
jgi:hypothetical protein